ncbi:MAG: GIY-YIG nuclease family protein [Minisyncoccia bacterium]
MACIYVIENKLLGKLYTGSSRENEPSVRITAHNTGKVQSTKSGIPWKLVHAEMYNNYADARKRELFLKSGRGRELLKQILS